MLLNKKHRVRDYGGSAKEVAILSDHQSALLRELVHELNEAAIPILKEVKNISPGGGASSTVRVPLGCWRQDAWIREVFLANTGNASLSGADTKVSIKTCSQGDFKIRSMSQTANPGPLNPTTILEVSRFDLEPWSLGQGLWSYQLPQTTAPAQITGSGRGFIVKAGDLLYAEFENQEIVGSCSMTFGVLATPTDRISLLPGDLQKVLRSPNQDFFVTPKHNAARNREIPGDTNSAVVRELAAQLNAVEIPIIRRFKQVAPMSFGGYVVRIPVGRWNTDTVVKDLRIINHDIQDLIVDTTSIAVKRAKTNDLDLRFGPISSETLFEITMFSAGNFPGKSDYWWDQFIAGVNCGTVTDRSKGFVPAGEMVYLEFTNNEASVREIIMQITMGMTDRFAMQPGDLQDNVRFPVQDYQRSRRN